MRAYRIGGLVYTRAREKKSNKQTNKPTKKSHDPNISPPRGGATARPIFTKLGSFGLGPDVIKYAKSQDSIFHTVRLARGSILGFQHYFDCRL